jgi:DNA-binding response OmpR family regulator
MQIRILIVDGEEEFVKTLSERLSIRNYFVDTAFSGEGAIEKIKNTILMW